LQALRAYFLNESSSQISLETHDTSTPGGIAFFTAKTFGTSCPSQKQL